MNPDDQPARRLPMPFYVVTPDERRRWDRSVEAVLVAFGEDCDTETLWMATRAIYGSNIAVPAPAPRRGD